LNLLTMAKTVRLVVVVLSVWAASCGGEADRSAPERPDTAAAARSTPPPASERPAPRARPRIVFLGDSLTAGLGLDEEESVPALVQKRLDEEGYDYEVVNAGVSGDTSAGGLSRLDWSLEGDVRWLVIELGANDGLRGLPVPAMKQNLATIITRAKQRGVTVLLTGMEAPPNYGEAYTSDFRKAFRDLAREHDVAFMPFFLEGVAGIPALNQRDGIHPNPDGARLIERKIWGALEPLLDSKD
jgi:acyl-CoA thioesterase-1